MQLTMFLHMISCFFILNKGLYGVSRRNLTNAVSINRFTINQREMQRHTLIQIYFMLCVASTKALLLILIGGT
jgi:hypothetical protein